MRARVLGLALLFAVALADIDPGEIGLEFFGNEYAYTQKMPNFPTQDMSLTLRIRAQGGNVLNYGVQQGTKPFDSTHLALTSAASLTISRGSGSPWQTGTNFADGQWHALGLTWKMSTGEMKLYKDGTLVGTTIMSKGITMSVDGNLLLGQFQRCAVGCFEESKGLRGSLADITLWSKVLTPDQISYLSTNAPSGDETGLVSFWPLFEKDGDLAADKASGINDLFLGGPTVSTDVTGDAANSLSFHKYGAVVLQPKNDLPTGDWTIEFWIKTNTLEDATIFSYYSSGANKYPFVVRNPGMITVEFMGGQINTQTSVSSGAWNHVAITWTKSSGRLFMFKNGAQTYPPAWLPKSDYDLMPTLSTGASLEARPLRVSLGSKLLCESGSCLDYNSGFDGLLLEVRFWGAARTQDQVTSWKDHFLPSDPLPDNLMLYWKLDDQSGVHQTADSSQRGQLGLYTSPKFRNTLIAPPFPTLDDVNQKVNNLKNQLSDLLDYVKDVLEPQEKPAADTKIELKDEGQCDRRYKYLCTHKVTTAPAGTAPAAGSSTTASPTAASSTATSSAATASASTKPKVALNLVQEDNVNVLVQRALGHNQMKHPQLVEQLGPAPHERPHIAPPAPVAVEVDDSDLLQVSEGTIPSAPAAPPAVPAAVETSSSRRRHAWATGTPLSHSAGKSTPESGVRSLESVVNHNSVPSGHRHAWSTGKNENIGGSAFRAVGEVEFLEEEEDVDDKAPEAIVHSLNPRSEVLKMQRAAASEPPLADFKVKTVTSEKPLSSSDELDFSKLQHQFEEEEAKFDNFASEGENEFPQGWNFDLSTPIEGSTVDAAAPEQQADLSKELVISPPDPGTAVEEPAHAQAVIGFADVNGPQKHESTHAHSAPAAAAPPAPVPKEHHEHHHHHRHHHHDQEKALKQAPAPKTKAVAPSAPATRAAPQKPAASAKTAAKLSPHPQARQAAVKAATASDTGVGNKFEQLIMPGAETEWDEAIAEGVGNSDLAEDGSNFASEAEVGA